MRFAELCLERYGSFEDRRLPLRAGSPDFHMIYGPNEAGKSTTLAAVSDLLFGIPQRSPYNFRFDYALMRIGAVLEEGDQRLACRRRKTRDQSLVDAQDQPLDEGQLFAMLHGLSRETFRSGFSLDQAGLRRGGEAMVKANDDLGQALFAAGSGLTGIAAIQTALDEEIDAIWAKTRSQKRSFTAAERQYDDSMSALRAHQLRPREWLDARADVARREEELAGLKEQQAALSARRRAAERLRRIGPPLRARASLLSALAQQGDVVAFLPQEEAQAEAMLAALAQAMAESDLAHRLREDALAHLAALRPDPIVALADRIEALIERRGEITKSTADLARLDIECRGMTARAAALRTELGAIGDIPSRLVVNRLRAIASRHAAATTGLRTHADSLADLKARAQPLREELADALLAEGLEALRAAIGLVRGLGDDFEARCDAGHAAAEAAAISAAAAMAPLLPWAGDMEALARLHVIDDQEIQAAQEAERTCAARLEEDQVEQRRLGEELQRLDSERSRFATTSTAVSTDEVSQARSARDTLWSDIDAHLRDRQPLAHPAATGDAFAAALSQADRVADRRYGTAEASAQLAALDDRRASLALQRDQAERRASDAAAALAARRGEWLERLQAIALPPLEPLRLRSWYSHRKSALDLHRAEAEARQQADRNRERRADAAAALARALGTAAPDSQGLGALLAAAERERTAGETLEQAFLEKRARLAGHDEEISRLERQIAQDQRAVRDAQGAWDAEQASLSITLDLADMEGRLSLIDELRVELDGIRTHEQRIAGIAGDRQGFETDVAAVAAQSEMAPDGTSSQTLDALRARLAQARIVAQSIDTHAAERDRRQAEIAAAEHGRDAILAALTPILARGGLYDAQGLPAALERSREARETRAHLADAERQILAEGDGYSLADLAIAWETSDSDAAAGQAEALEQELAALTEALSASANALGVARRTFDALDERPQTAADALADAEAAQAEMAAQAEIYILKRTQSLMLRWAMDRYRDRRQDPLLARAGTLFRTLTLDRFVALKVDYEPAAPRLLGLRADRVTLVPIDGMSEGTRDQLFLALRLAAVEQAIAAGVTMPFLADDLFVNFDDDRAEAGLRVLVELARSTQVLFFTHHPHLCEIGRRVVGDDPVSECILS